MIYDGYPSASTLRNDDKPYSNEINTINLRRDGAVINKNGVNEIDHRTLHDTRAMYIDWHQ